MLVFDPATNTWEQKANMPLSRDFHACAGLGGDYYAVGGPYGVSNGNKCQKYTPSTYVWSYMATMSTFRHKVNRGWLPAWLLKNPVTFGHHFPAIHRDAAQTKGAVLLSIVSRWWLHRLEHAKHKLIFCTPAGGTKTSSCQPGRDTLSHFQHATSTGMHD